MNMAGQEEQMRRKKTNGIMDQIEEPSGLRGEGKKKKEKKKSLRNSNSMC